jgi:hypothetical protein
VYDSIWGLSPRRQINIRPFQREKLAIRPDARIYGDYCCVSEILGSVCEIELFFLEAQNPFTSFRLRQFVDAGRVSQPAPINCDFQNPSQCAEVAVYGYDRILGDFLPMTGISARLIACNRI